MNEAKEISRQWINGKVRTIRRAPGQTMLFVDRGLVKHLRFEDYRAQDIYRDRFGDVIGIFDKNVTTDDLRHALDGLEVSHE